MGVNNRAHDFHLSLSICKGECPEIIEGTPQCYIDLMKKCWDLDPLKRPSASELKIIFKNWQNGYYSIKYIIADEEVRKHLENIENKLLRKDIEEFLDKALKEKQNNNSNNSSKPKSPSTSIPYKSIA